MPRRRFNCVRELRVSCMKIAASPMMANTVLACWKTVSPANPPEMFYVWAAGSSGSRLTAAEGATKLEPDGSSREAAAGSGVSLAILWTERIRRPRRAVA